MQMACWSDLADDVLEILTGLLSFPDQHRFSAVCHNWRLIAKQKRRYPPKPQLPWLALGEDPETKKRNFFSLSEQRYYSIDIPELYDQFICGSSHGWLYAVDNRMNGRVVNPLTRECIHLPSSPPPHSEMHNITTYSHEPVHDSAGCNLEARRYAGWTVIDSLWGSMTDIFYFEGQLYVAQLGFHTVYIIDVGDRSKPELKVNQIDTLDRRGRNLKYIMVFQGKLLIVSRYEGHCYTYHTKNFEVRAPELNCVESGHQNISLLIWRVGANLRNLSGHAVFLGNNSPIFVNPAEFPTEGCITNGIYFSDMAPSYYWEKHGHDFGVCHMDNDTLRSFCSNPDDHVLHPRDAALTWFTPSP